MEYQQPLLRYPHSNNSLLSSGNAKKSTAYEPRTEAISPAINDDIINAEDSTSKSTKDEQALIVEKLKKVEAEIVQTDLQIVRLRRQKEQLEQAQAAPKHDEDQENVCDTKQLSIAKLVYHENRAKAQKAHAKLECLGGSTELPVYNQPSDNVIYHRNAAKFTSLFKTTLIDCFKARFQNRLKLEDSVSTEYDRRMEKWLKSIESEDSQPSKRIKDAKTREFFEKQFPELKKARESGERFSRVGQRVARSDAEVAELLDGIIEREDQDKKVKSYAVIPPMLEEMRSKKPKFINTNGYVDDIVAEYKEYQILNTWTDEEKDIFRENYLQHPKDFGLISRMTSRKNVANCVQYYYLSKKSENYKQLLKRQQKRRTRSFVRPAATTPANTEQVNDSSKTNGVNENQACDTVAADSAEQSDSKSSALIEQSNVKQEASITNLANDNITAPKSTCCICNCDFSDNNQFRNVTRSNHQLYGISPDALKPGMKICYPCRFRHVKHPNFEEPTIGPEPMDSDTIEPQQQQQTQQTHHNELIATDMTMMEVDPLSVRTGPDKMCSSENNENKPIIPQIDSSDCPPDDLTAEALTNNFKQNTDPDQSNNNRVQQRTCVRDIIYQAIEMSFQKPTGSTMKNAPDQLKQELPRPDNSIVNPIIPQQHPAILNSTLPAKQIATYRPIHPPLQQQQQQQPPPPPPPPYHLQNVQYLNMNHQHQLQVEMQQKHRQQLLEFNIRQHQFQVQMQQQQQTQFRHQPQFPPPPMAHGVGDLRGIGAIDDGVLNLSAKPVKSLEVKSQVIESAAIAPPTPVYASPVGAPPVSAPQVVVTQVNPIVSAHTNVAPAANALLTAAPTIGASPAAATSAAAVAIAPLATAPPVVESPVTPSSAATTIAVSPPAPKLETPTTSSSTSTAPTREDSRSPSEMVIDESADAHSPESTSSESSGEPNVDLKTADVSKQERESCALEKE